MESLLGLFFNRINGSQENIASESLVYILNKSETAKNSILKYLRTEAEIEVEIERFYSQEKGENNERPDIIGKNREGQERLIIETKFWASLTMNQPNTYLSRLKNIQSVLLFICPASRVGSLYIELKNRIPMEFTPQYLDRHNCIKFPQEKCIIVRSWKDILENIKKSLLTFDEKIILSDLDQLIGYCDKIDETSFLPASEKDFDPSIGRRIISYYHLIDHIIVELEKRKLVTKKYSKGSRKYGIASYFGFQGIGYGLNLNFEYWSKNADTPFWLIIADEQLETNNWKMSEILKQDRKSVV